MSENVWKEQAIQLMALLDQEKRNNSEVKSASQKLLNRWDEFNASDANYEQAYFRLAKYARDDWEELREAVSAPNTQGGERR